jgi:hypothetical protein
VWESSIPRRVGRGSDGVLREVGSCGAGRAGFGESGFGEDRVWRLKSWGTVMERERETGRHEFTREGRNLYKRQQRWVRGRFNRLCCGRSRLLAVV